MGRLIAFFLLVLVLSSLLRTLPGLGSWMGGFFGFWLVAIVLSLALTRLAVVFTRTRALADEVRRLGEVDSPHNRGKLGALLLANGRVERAIPHLEAAAAGEPERPEWRYRLGSAQLSSGRLREALATLERSAEMDPELAYGEVQLLVCEARLRTGDAQGALDALDTFDRNHGASPESACRRGIALRRLGRRAEARASFARVAELARRSARFQRAHNRPWVWRAWLARLI